MTERKQGDPPMRVLVVDDELANRQLLQAFLMRMGHRTLLACNGQEGVERFASDSPDLVLMDVMMPLMDGFEATRRIKAMAGARWVPVIYLTALSREEYVLEGLQAGGDDFLSKPLNLGVLEAKLRAFARALSFQARLAGALEQSRAVSDNIVDGVITFDQAGTVRYANPAAARMFGYTQEEFEGLNVAMLVPEAQRGRQSRLLHYQLGRKQAPAVGSGHEVMAVRSDGSLFAVEAGVSEVSLDGEPCFISVLRDVSERRRMERELKNNAARLQRYHDAQEAENAFARELLSRMMRHEGLEGYPGLEFKVDAAEHFSGDTVVAARSPQERIYVMLADATGHGLAAAISLLPALNVFYGMVRRDLPLSLIVAEMNARLRAAMPPGRFVAASVLCLDTMRQRGEIWVGGMPEALWLDGAGEVVRRFGSTNLPLGIVDAIDLDDRAESFAWQDRGQILLCSDGVLDASNAAGEAFGAERLVGALRGVPMERRLQALRERLSAYLDGASAHDDASLVALDLPSVRSWRGEREPVAV